MRTAVITYSPHADDDGLPWRYEAPFFLVWFDSVIMSNDTHKMEGPMPSFDDAVDIARGMGYELEVED